MKQSDVMTKDDTTGGGGNPGPLILPRPKITDDTTGDKSTATPAK